MNRKLTLTTAISLALLSGCATQSSNNFQAFQPQDLNALVKSGHLVQKTDSFFVINDSSSSMSNTYQGDVAGTKLDAEKDLLNKFNKTIPAINLNAGLRSFGFGPCLSWGTSVLNQPLQKYTQASFNNAITSLECSSGGTPLADALEVTAQDISNAPGNIALIVFSDGKDDSSPLPAASALKTQHGDKLCIYTVWVGNENDMIGQANLSQIAKTSSCGFSTTAANISTPAGMNEFVKNVFLKEGNPVAPVVDHDQDGVVDPKDKCPDSPKGAIVDKDGCWAFHGVLFDFDSDKIKSTNDPLIANAVHVLKLNPQLNIEIQGHTDSYGKDAYNQKLSERRALAVKNELVRHGIASSRLTTAGFGESTPVDSNETDEGRAYNRRVAYKIIK